MKKIYMLFASLFLFFQCYSQGTGQNNLCENALPFCTGTLYQFPAGVNAGQGQSGPNYMCLKTTPNPAWYYMRILTPGSITIKMFSTPSYDIDFCCWGPYSSQYACDSLTSNKKIDCSYSTSATEFCDIPNGQTGQYYILIITNFSNKPCNITFSQTGGTGTTDCSILPPPCSNNSPICAGQTLQLTASAVSNATYEWSGPNNFSSNLQNPQIPNAQPVNSGNYYLNITVNGQPSQDSSLTVANIYQPVAYAGNDTSITYGTPTTLHGNASDGSGAYHYHWEDAALFVDPDVQNPATHNLYSATVFELTITDDTVGCTATDNVTVSLLGGPLSVGANASPSTICAGATTALHAIGSGGTGNYSYLWTGPGGFSSTLQNPTVQPAQTSTYSVKISDGYNDTTNYVTVSVNQLPIAHAGNDDTIPYGTYKYLSGSVTGGSGNYAYQWSPADKLVIPSVSNPQTANLTATTIYSLVATDNVTGCTSNNSANVTVFVAGGPLNVNPVATPSYICKGATTQIHASAGGGNAGFYTYSWVSDPSGFTSTDPDPVVNPVVDTKYTVTVNDGFNSTTGNTTVHIYPQPVINMGPLDSLVCIYSIITLDAGNPGSVYLWSNGDTARYFECSATGIADETQSYSVTVTNQNGCVSSGTINILFSFNSCVGIEENNMLKGFRVFPNPTEGVISVEADHLTDNIFIVISSVSGSELKRVELKANHNGKSVKTLDLSDLSKGIYFLKIEQGESSQIQKLIIR